MHTLITGVTLTGKTTLARMFAREHVRRGHIVMVYDPMGTGTAGGDWGETAVIFNDEKVFMETLKKGVPHEEGQEIAVFVDESDLVLSHRQEYNHWLARRGRHYGYRVYMLTQRPTMIAPNCRTQVGCCYMFRLARTDADFCAREFGHTTAAEYDLDTGDFLVLRSGKKEISRGNVFKLLGVNRNGTERQEHRHRGGRGSGRRPDLQQVDRAPGEQGPGEGLKPRPKPTRG